MKIMNNAEYNKAYRAAKKFEEDGYKIQKSSGKAIWSTNENGLFIVMARGDDQLGVFANGIEKYTNHELQYSCFE